MFGKLFLSSDIVSSTLGAATIATFATGLLTLLGLSWVSDRWRVPLALVGAALFASCFSYLAAGQVWVSTQTTSGAYRYIGWLSAQPLQVVAIYFVARSVGEVPVGVFWRSLVAAVLMVVCRYLGDAGVFNPTVADLLSIAFWLYVLGELYFGAMSTAVRKSSGPVRLGYFWIRLFLTIGWALYPILFFVEAVVGTGQAAPVVVLYTLVDTINIIAVALIILTLCSTERY